MANDSPRSLNEEINYCIGQGFHRNTIELSTLHYWASVHRTELDRLRAEVERLRHEVKHNSEGWDTALDVAAKYLERAERAEAALATARKDALEEAAKCAEKYADNHPSENVTQTAMRGAVRYAAESIRALITQSTDTSWQESPVSQSGAKDTPTTPATDVSEREPPSPPPFRPSWLEP